ncbi:unnamed protein product [Dibothriocephalus latus]|uniref:Uncharacterized protein n=1 Tax=Dibothriocephalus latus TaxID=60516 RepID=A0A3P7NHS2_DIBLA|nr:unnamed protein product [Dibothriocephalus latus]
MMPTLLRFATLTVVLEISVDDRRGLLYFRQLVGGLYSLMGRISVMLPLLLRSPPRSDFDVPVELLLPHSRDAI